MTRIATRYDRFLPLIHEYRMCGLAQRRYAFSKISGAVINPEFLARGDKMIAKADRVRDRIIARQEQQFDYMPGAVREGRIIDFPVFNLREVFLNAWDTHTRKPGVPVQAEPCICQRMYDTGRTGLAHIDNWLAGDNKQGTREWDAEWYKLAAHMKLDSDTKHDVGVKYATDAKLVKEHIEAACLAPIHYGDVILTDMYGGRPVFTSLDAEKAEENALAIERETEVYADDEGGFVTIDSKRREYINDRDDEDNLDSEDVFTVARRARAKEADSMNDQQQLPITEAHDPTTQSRKQRKEARAAAGVQDTPARDTFEALYRENRAKNAAKDRQARRDVISLLRPLDIDTRNLYVAYLTDARRAKKSWVTIRAHIRRSVTASKTLVNA